MKIGHFYVQGEGYFLYFINIQSILNGTVQSMLPDCEVWLQIFYACNTMDYTKVGPTMQVTIMWLQLSFSYHIFFPIRFSYHIKFGLPFMLPD
jgi:hypothetical protein